MARQSHIHQARAHASLFGIARRAGCRINFGKYPDLRVVSTYQPALTRPIMGGFLKTATETYNKVDASNRKLNADGTIKRILANYGQ